MKTTRLLLLAPCIAACIATPLHAADPAPDRWTAALDVRYRYEYVDDEARPLAAHAQTARARFGIATPTWHGFSAYADLEHVEALDERYDSTANGRTRYAVVSDPEATELNQAFVAWKPVAGTALVLGRQRIAFDNQRHFGNVGFRQNEQTFDAFRAERAFGATTIRYAWLDEVHRIFGDDHPNPLSAEQDLSAHLVNASRTFAGGTLVGYGYFVENEDLPATSTRTLGVRYAGARPWRATTLGYTLEAAAQSDYADAPSPGTAPYLLAEVSLAANGVTTRFGYESLGEDGGRAFQTPFATLHAFNGWADRFLVTPTDGLVDRYLAVGGKAGAYNLAANVHDYRADRGDARYGREFGASIGRTFGTHVDAELKAARYSADAFSRDATKVWLAVTLKY